MPASRRTARARWPAALALGLASSGAGAGLAADASLGERFYLRGVAASGRPVAATVQGDLSLPSGDMPCVNCHRRSGLGSFEGTVRVPPVAGQRLFEPVTAGEPRMGPVRTKGAGTRPAYDERSLARVLRDGVDPAGRRLSPTMPRYAVEDADVAALAAYLRSLSSSAPAGVTPTTLHLATITSTTGDPDERRSMLETLRAFVASKNAETRGEARRRERGPWDMKPHYEGFRRWVLHDWTLRGDEREWAGQLAAYYASQPVFAVVSGSADGDWAPIHDFCEQNRVPCVLPLTDLPPPDEPLDGFYSLYFSAGLALEARTLAAHFTRGQEPPAPAAQAPSDRSPPAPDVLQVFRCGSPAERGALELGRALHPGIGAQSRCLEAFTPAAWQRALQRRPAVLVAWLGRAELAGLEELARQPDGLRGTGAVYLSSSLLGDDGEPIAGPLAEKAFLAHPYVRPEDFERHASRSLAWFRARGIAPTKRRVAVNTLFAATLVADALAHPRTLDSREYFVERIEHMIGRSPQPSAFPSLSLAAQRRFASVGCYVLKLPWESAQSFTPVAEWRVPEARPPIAQEKP